MKWPIVSRLLVAAPLVLLLGACQVTAPGIRALLCDPVDPAADPLPVDPLEVAPAPSAW